MNISIIKKSIRIYIFLVFLVVTGPAYTAEKVTIGVGEWAPLISKDLKHYGVLARIVTESFALEGVKVEYEWAKWRRSYENVKLGSWDASLGWTKTAEREQDVLFGDAIFEQYQVFFHLKSFPFEWESYNDLRGLNIGKVRGYFYGKEFEEAEKDRRINIDIVSKDELNFKKLVAGRIDVFPLNILTGFAIARQSLPPEDLELVTYHPRGLAEPSLSHMVFNNSEKGVHLKKIFNSGLSKLKQSGKVEQYFEESRQGLYVIQ